MKKTRLTAAVCAAILLLVSMLAACSAGGGSTETENETESETMSETIEETTEEITTEAVVYPLTSCKIGGVGIEKFVIVTKRKGGDNAVAQLTDAIAALCGVEIPTVKCEDFTGGNAIFLGCADASGNHLQPSIDSQSYYLTTVNGNPVIDCANGSVREAAVADYLARCFPEGITGDWDAPLIEGVVTGSNFEEKTSGLTAVSEGTLTQLAEGICLTELDYTDRNGDPVKLFALSVAPGSASFYVGTAEDGTVLVNKGGTVIEEIEAAAGNGKRVIAGVNADFFNMQGDYQPCGLCVKNGEVLHEAGYLPYFALLKDGSVVIDTALNYYKYVDKIAEAVGGQPLLMKDGKFVVTVDERPISSPKTFVGIKPDGTVILFTIDGRQPGYSVGANAADVMKILREFGCTDGLNLDGGGSTQLVLRDVDTGVCTMKNKPSDVNPYRKIQNSLLVVLNGEE